METIDLRGYGYIPVLGFGTWQLQGDVCKQAVSHALSVGYTHIDTAEVYENQVEVGQAIKNSPRGRGELFVTSKVFHNLLHYDDVLAACDRTLDQLQLDYLDLYLIHWPNHEVPIKETLDAMSKLQEEGKVKAIGVSNFTITHLQQALDTGITFVNNQVEFHPSLNQTELKAFCDEHKIALTAYSPIAQGQDLQLPVIQELAGKYGKTPAQTILNWIISKGMVAIPRSATPARIEENLGAVGWKLAEEDVAKIDAVGGHNRIVNPSHGEFGE